MTEEVKVVTTPVEGEQVEQSAAPEKKEPSALEKRALEMGWRPKEEFHGDEDDFIDAKEFVRRAPLFEKIEKQSSQIKNVQKALEALKTHYTKVQETEYKRALEKLQAAREEAITNSDGATFTALDKEIKNVEGQMAEVQKAARDPIVQEPQELPVEFQAWQRRNGWYESVGYMKAWADEYGVQLKNQGLSPREVLAKVEEGVRKEFPHKFINQNKASAPDVESGKTVGSKRASADTFELSEAERSVMNTLVRQGVLTKEKYIADLKAAKGIK